ncbi:MAG: 4-alpha-glucanotransferase, partial [Verrucomicrobia bacterium]|nr:4-alpha-glucanotransferase [Verrucomicrobiota bacterium]
EMLVEEGFLSSLQLSNYPALNRRRCDFENVASAKWHLFRIALATFTQEASPECRAAYSRFLTDSVWLDEYVESILEVSGFSRRNPEFARPIQLNIPKDLSSNDGDLQRFTQFLFFSQWDRLRRYANDRGVLMVGDTAFNMAIRGVDIRTRPELFEVDPATGEVIYEAGAPPDEFVPEGQFWHTGAYRWTAHVKENFGWWKSRLELNERLFDAFRLDHFRGFQASWVIPKHAGSPTEGHFVAGPGELFFKSVRDSFPGTQMFVEDLGTITDDVHRLRNSLGLAGMCVLQLAFNSDADHPYLPYKCVLNSVVYTETHDLQPIAGWFRDLPDQQKKRVREYVGKEIGNGVHWEFIRLALASVSDWAIIPAQDVLGLGEEGQMNVSGQIMDRNWRWRLEDIDILRRSAGAMAQLTKIYGRA